MLCECSVERVVSGSCLDCSYHKIVLFFHFLFSTSEFQSDFFF